MILFSLAMNEEQLKRLREVHQVDEGLMAKIADGDKEALTQLYEGTKTAVYSFALSILRNRQDAEDVMQDTFVQIYAKAADYRAQGKPMAWILAIVKNFSLMKLRKYQKNGEPTALEWDPPDARDVLGESLDRMVLSAAMTILTEEECQIIMLHAVAGQKHKEIASLLHLPLSTTLSKYHRALSKLKEYIEEDERNGR